MFDFVFASFVHFNPCVVLYRSVLTISRVIKEKIDETVVKLLFHLETACYLQHVFNWEIQKEIDVFHFFFGQAETQFSSSDHGQKALFVFNLVVNHEGSDFETADSLQHVHHWVKIESEAI